MLIDDPWANETWITPVVIPAPFCDGVNHPWEIYTADCQCLLEDNPHADVHDVLRCPRCRILWHDTPYYTEGE